ncbi:hypothetical protein Q8F55_007834 [Vanrija albida]|uniref:Zn(2)-C6 fungal-type domain-containing protein n=1 Tax=Vanrija albida TaxID=181172 RepID=A0ABR3PUM6_9TREE
MFNFVSHHPHPHHIASIPLAAMDAYPPPPPPPPQPAEGSSSTGVKRTRLGCLTCRKRRTKPTCNACNRLQKECTWQDAHAPSTRRLPRRPNATACEACRSRKLKCEGDPRNGACTRCEGAGLECEWAAGDRPRPYDRPESERGAADFVAPSASSAQQTGPSPAGPYTPHPTTSSHHSHHSAAAPSGVPSLVQEPSSALADTEALVDLYFDSVHHFGFLSFIHKLRFKRLLAAGKAPRDLTMAMLANTLRFACDPTPENLARSDQLIDTVIHTLVPKALQGFGAVQLMTTILTHTCEVNRNNFASSWILTAISARMMQMMSLQTFDRTFPDDLSDAPLSPLLSREALRRLAWAVFYQDSMADGGNYGFQLIDVMAYRVQLPCNEQSFLGNDDVQTEPLYPRPHEKNTAALGISGHLIRAAHLRRCALHLAFRVQNREAGVEELEREAMATESQIADFVNSLPARYQFTADNTYLHHKRLPAYIVLHLLRHNLFIILGRAKLMLYKLDPRLEVLLPAVRKERVSHALPIAAIIEEGLKYNQPFDPHTAIQAYVALEILLFEPRRLAANDPSVNPRAENLMAAIPPLLQVIRDIGRRSDMMRLLHVEAVHRMLRCDLLSLLTSYDLEAFSAEYRMVGTDEAEFNFRDFRFAKMERQRRGVADPRSTSALQPESLLEYPDADTVSAQPPSPQRRASNHSSQSHRRESQQDPRDTVPGLVDFAFLENFAAPPQGGLNPWLNSLDPVAGVQAGDLSWLLGPATDQSTWNTADPEFWNALAPGPVGPGQGFGVGASGFQM